MQYYLVLVTGHGSYGSYSSVDARGIEKVRAFVVDRSFWAVLSVYSSDATLSSSRTRRNPFACCLSRWTLRHDSWPDERRDAGRLRPESESAGLGVAVVFPLLCRHLPRRGCQL